MAAHRVRALLMGGQACVFYGAAEFSRDVDLALVSDATNLERLEAALRELMAEPVSVPPLKAEFLERGHAVHFRCQHPEAQNLRVDLMAKMRGVAAFDELWERRTSITDSDGMVYELLSLPDGTRIAAAREENFSARGNNDRNLRFAAKAEVAHSALAGRWD
jgi:hypothetical protein